MTELLRRFLWSLPLLFVSAMLLFLVLGKTAPMSSRLRFPLFYNSTPTSAETAANDIVSRLLTTQGPAFETAMRELIELGGAGLPTVLGRLPSLSVPQRRLVAEALWPIAERMGHSRPSFGISPRDGTVLDIDQKLLFWERYQEEHALDLRPQAVARLVRRMSERGASLRSADLDAVDTYALPVLVENLGWIRDSDDVARVARLAEKISRVTGRSWSLRSRDSIESARQVASEIRWFFDEHGPKWSEKSRLELLVARISQTEYALWLFRLTRQVIGLDESTSLSRILTAGRLSLPIWLSALCGLLLVGPMVAATLLVLQLKAARFRLERLGLRAGLAAALLLCVSSLVRRSDASFLVLLLIAILTGTAFSAFVLQRELSDRLDFRTHHVLRSRSLFSRILAVARWLGPSIPTMTPLAVAEAAGWVAVLEMATSTRGLGFLTINALREGNLYVLMLVGLGLGALTGGSQVLADLLLGTPRRERGET